MTDPSPSSPTPAKENLPDPADVLTVVLAYAAFAALWILLSDKAVQLIFTDPAHIIMASTIKGWLFVAVTSLLLYGLMRRLPCPPPQGGPAPVVRLRPLLLPLTLLVMAIVVLTVGAIVHTFMHKRDTEVARLQAIADLKTRQIADWLGERRGDALFVQSSQFWSELYVRWRDTGDVASRDQLQGRLDRYRKNKAFQKVLLLDELGEPLWDSQGASFPDDAALRAAVRQAAIDHNVRCLGPYRDPAGRLSLDFVAPLPPIGGRPGPVIVLRVAPVDYLFPALQTWPVPSASGESLLFRRDGDQILFLNELRHRADTAAKLRVPVAEQRLLASQVVRGAVKLGSLVKGIDYRGLPVMGVARAIPGTDWFLMAKLDRAEVYAEATRDALWIALAGLLALFMAVAGAFLSRQRQELAFARRESQAQADKLRALQLLDSIAAGSTDTVFVKDLQGRYLLINQAAARYVGKSADQVLGRDDTALFPAAQAALLMANDRRVMADDRTITLQEELSTVDGQVVFLATKGPIHDDAGKVIGMFGVGRDITERLRVEQALRESEANLARAQAIAHMGSWRLDIKTGDLSWSAETYRIFGIAEGTPINVERYLACIHPEDRERVGEARQAGLTGAPYDIEYRILVGGEVRWVHGQGELVLDATGQPLAGVGVVQDVSERKRAEEERERLQAQLLQAQKMESVGRLAGGVAHDFNNMLSVILGYAELAQMRGKLPAEIEADLQEIIKAAERSADLTRQLLAFARKQTIIPKVLDLNDSTAGMLKMLRRLIGEDIELAWLPGAQLWPVKVDPAQIDQILVNLAVNARDAITGGGKVTIETKNVTFDEARCAVHVDFVPGDFVMLAVSDDGIGMERHVVERIFEPFFTTKGVGQGTGLGLATVYGIVKQNEGVIDVWSEPGRGTTFKIYLPRFMGTAGEAELAPQAETPRGGGETLLLVEDEAAVRQMVQDMLVGLGYTVLTAGTPNEALRLVESYAGDGLLLIADVVMPEMNGRELAERAILIRPDLKCLFMSGYTAEVIAQQGVVDEGVCFLQKPFTIHDLALQVRAALAK